MQNLNAFKALSIGDFRNIQRDNMLAWMAIIPLLLALLIRVVVPRLTDWLLTNHNFDLQSYYPVIMAYTFVVATPAIFGAIIGFMFLDEKDDDTLTAMRVTPLTLNSYLVYRLVIPVILSLILTLLVFPIAGLMALHPGLVLLVAALAALEAPILALILAAFAENKVAGFALMKGVGLVLELPIIAFFIRSDWELLAGLIFTYWPVKAMWVAQSGGNFWPYLGIGLVYHLLLLLALLKRFNTELSHA